MNYRHAFHAGNFADLVKHAALLRVLEQLTTSGGPLTVIDTHAGRGLYDLAGPEARKSGEAEAGVVQLMRAADAPAEFAPLREAVAALNPAGDVHRYPGSPVLIADALRPQDRYLACELRGEEHDALATALRGRRGVETRNADGYAVASGVADGGRLLVLIDPPFERADDYTRIVETVAEVKARRPEAAVLIWLPIKDLETFDSFLRDLEDVSPARLLVTEARVRPLTDPMKMNGCAMVLVDGPDVAEAFAAISGWVAGTLGLNGEARTYAIA